MATGNLCISQKVSRAQTVKTGAAAVTIRIEGEIDRSRAVAQLPNLIR